jgi:hypothetical protein
MVSIKRYVIFASLRKQEKIKGAAFLANPCYFILFYFILLIS